jgi:hypothetical protein
MVMEVICHGDFNSEVVKESLHVESLHFNAIHLVISQLQMKCNTRRCEPADFQD